MKALAMLLVLFAAAAVAATPPPATCVITGTCYGEPTDDPSLGTWKYTLTISWDNSRYGMSHLDLIVDDGLNCSANDLAEGLHFPNPSGDGTGEGGCQLTYEAYLNPNGDPSLDIDIPLYKFEPDESLGCEAGETGVPTFVFYSDYAPYPVEEHNLALVEKYATYNCLGNLTGEFPALPCAPVGNEDATWGSIKSRFTD